VIARIPFVRPEGRCAFMTIHFPTRAVFPRPSWNRWPRRRRPPAPGPNAPRDPAAGRPPPSTKPQRFRKQRAAVRIARPTARRRSHRPSGFGSWFAGLGPVRLCTDRSRRSKASPGRNASDPAGSCSPCGLQAGHRRRRQVPANSSGLCAEHRAYEWLRGDVPVNYHMLADFRVQHGELLRQVAGRFAGWSGG